MANAASAELTILSMPINVGSAVRMTLRTVGFGRIQGGATTPPQQVDSAANEFDMGGVDAATIAAQVVALKGIGNRGN